MLEKEGIPIVNLVLAKGKKYTVIDVICDEDSEIPDPKNIMLTTLKYYLEYLNSKEVPENIKITIHHRKTYTGTFNVGKDAEIYKIIGSIPGIVWKYNLYLDKYKYRLVGNDLELSLILKRTGIYSTINIRDIVRIIYEKIKDKWKGKLILRAKIGTWGLEATYP